MLKERKKVMAKNKHELLASRLKKMLGDHCEFSKKVLNTLQLVQMHFYEPLLLIGRPEPANKFISIITKTHCIGLQFFSPSSDIKRACKKLACFGAIIKKNIYLKSERFYSSEGKWIIPWKVEVILPNTQQQKNKKQLTNMLLYCPDITEFSNEIDWFEDENCSNSLNYQLLELISYIKKDKLSKALIYENLDQIAKPFFLNFFSNKTDILNLSSYVPNDTDNIADAYEKASKALRNERNNNNYNLMCRWVSHLEELMFKDVPYAENEKKIFINKWHYNLFGNQSKKNEKEDRWEQAKTIDRTKAIDIILYFLNRFIEDPNKRKTEGELVCFLWTLIWLSYELNTTDITLSDVMSLNTTHLKENLELSYKDNTIEISFGLYQLLSVLKGKGVGKRVHLLFPNLASKSRKWIENVFKKASIELFGKEADPISPSVFCSFPHPLEGIRKPKKKRISERKTPVSKNLISSYRKDIKKIFQQNT